MKPDCFNERRASKFRLSDCGLLVAGITQDNEGTIAIYHAVNPSRTKTRVYIAKGASHGSHVENFRFVETWCRNLNHRYLNDKDKKKKWENIKKPTKFLLRNPFNHRWAFDTVGRLSRCWGSIALISASQVSILGSMTSIGWYLVALADWVFLPHSIGCRDNSSKSEWLGAEDIEDE